MNLNGGCTQTGMVQTQAGSIIAPTLRLSRLPDSCTSTVCQERLKMPGEGSGVWIFWASGVLVLHLIVLSDFQQKRKGKKKIARLWLVINIFSFNSRPRRRTTLSLSLSLSLRFVFFISPQDRCADRVATCSLLDHNAGWTRRRKNTVCSPDVFQ
jgi:hypothetical protein